MLDSKIFFEKFIFLHKNAILEVELVTTHLVVQNQVLKFTFLPISQNQSISKLIVLQFSISSTFPHNIHISQNEQKKRLNYQVKN